MNSFYSFTQDGIFFEKPQFLTIHLQRNTVIDQVILSNNGLKEIHTTLCRYQKSRY